jgi:EAL domain-containing protein (putative c-di-GMP-specific phosphodiesterase class I)
MAGAVNVDGWDEPRDQRKASRVEDAPTPPRGIVKDTMVIERTAELQRGSQRALGNGAAPLENVPPAAAWYLESMDGARQLRRVPVFPLPFRIGRRPGLELTLPSIAVSKNHAEIYGDPAGKLRLRDLGSTNGSFVNREPVEDGPVREGDVLHFGDFEFRLGCEEFGSEEETPGQSTVSLRTSDLPHQFVHGTRELKELLRETSITVVFQPIVVLPSGKIAAYEALGRGRHPGLPESPLELFRVAESMGAEVELSRLFRKKAVQLVRHRTDMPTLFLNTHPAELGQPGLFESLEELREMAPHLDLALEIHESVLTNPPTIAELRRMLSEINVGLAYDDFGAGQARLLELADAPPHFLKFDARFISGIDSALPSKRRLLGSLVSVARDLLVKTVAEGIETAAEADVCSRLGFTHAQGYHFARPMLEEAL